MATIKNLIICEDVKNEIQSDNTIVPQIIEELSVVQPYAVPGNYSFSVFCEVEGVKAETDDNIQMFITAPNGSKLFETDKIFFPNNVESDCGFCVDLRNFLFLSEGDYKIKVILNEISITEKILSVKAKTTGGVGND